MIDTLAGGDLLKYNQVLNLSYQDVQLKLKMDKDVNEYRDRLYKIMSKGVGK